MKRPGLDSFAVLTPAEMVDADRLALAGGITGAWLMENAGQAVKSVVLANYPGIQRAVILCGPGNNGGDGYVVARLLRQLGIDAIVHCSGRPKPGTDAQTASLRWKGDVFDLPALELRRGDVVIDGLYGAGFAGELRGANAAAAQMVNEADLPVIAIDLPSGLSGLTGKGACIRADHTVTFFRKKPGHLLYPGRQMCGTLHVADIGIPSCVLDEIAPSLWENRPNLFEALLPEPDSETHKYRRGAAGVFSGGAAATGAARLSAIAAARAGAGAVTVFGPADALPELAAQLTSVMIRRVDNAADAAMALEDAKLTALALGPGFGRHDLLRQITLLALGSGVPRGLVLDADVFSAFAREPEILFKAIASSASHVVLTPHEGEFQRVFRAISLLPISKVEKARQAAALSGAAILYKGPDTVIAAPGGRAAVNTNGGPELATAGSGDVLAGIIAGLLAQGLPAFEAACAGAHLHGEAGATAGRGLIAEDLAAVIRTPSAAPHPVPDLPPQEAGRRWRVAPDEGQR